MSLRQGILGVLIRSTCPLTISDIYYCLLTPAVLYTPLRINDELFELEKEYQVERVETIEGGTVSTKWKFTHKTTDLDDTQRDQTVNLLNEILEHMKQMQTQMDRIEKTLDGLKNNQ